VSSKLFFALCPGTHNLIAEFDVKVDNIRLLEPLPYPFVAVDIRKGSPTLGKWFRA